MKFKLYVTIIVLMISFQHKLYSQPHSTFFTDSLLILDARMTSCARIATDCMTRIMTNEDTQEKFLIIECDGFPKESYKFNGEPYITVLDKEKNKRLTYPMEYGTFYIYLDHDIPRFCYLVTDVKVLILKKALFNSKYEISKN